MRGADTTATHVAKLADQERARLSELLLEPLESEAVTICPDMWTDSVRQVSYLGMAASFVNDQFEYHYFDLCCSPFEEEDKTSESVLNVSKTFSVIWNDRFCLGNQERIAKIQYHRFISFEVRYRQGCKSGQGSEKL